MTKTVLIVEDEPSIITLLKYNLEKADFQTDTATNGEEALEKARNCLFDLIILDVMLPKLSGIEVCETLRAENNTVPIIMLTAKTTEYDKVVGLDIGADDYLTKPFSPKELIARINAILRRSNFEQVSEEKQATIVIGDIKLYPDRFEAYFSDETLELTRKEFELLVYLAQHKGRILSREQLLNAVWDYDFIGDTRIVDVQISHLREKIELDTKNPLYLKTVRGFGYKLEEPK